MKLSSTVCFLSSLKYHRHFQIAFSILFDHHLYFARSIVIIIALLLYYVGLNDSHCQCLRIVAINILAPLPVLSL